MTNMHQQWHFDSLKAFRETKTIHLSNSCTLELSDTSEMHMHTNKQWKRKTASRHISVEHLKKTLHLARAVYTHQHAPRWARTQRHRGRNCGQEAQSSLAESLIDWDKGLLMKQIAHQAGTTCFSDVTPFQTSPWAHRPRHGNPVCVCACLRVCLSVCL